jgi:hypothetical protein
MTIHYLVSNETIGTDFQGWATNAMTLREIIKALGVTYILDNGDEIIRSDRKHLFNIFASF